MQNNKILKITKRQYWRSRPFRSKRIEGVAGWCSVDHRVDRVLIFFSIRPNWDSPIPSPAGERVPPPLVQGGGGTHSLAGEEVGGSQFWRGDRHCDTLVKYMYVLCDVDLVLDFADTEQANSNVSYTQYLTLPLPFFFLVPLLPAYISWNTLIKIMRD